MSDLNPAAFEKLGVFYLGRAVDPANPAAPSEPLLYDARDLTTHAVCVGMTGSGKTGLCIDLLEEAAIDGIPAIVVDPKGDLGNLLLTFPNLLPEDFRPWVDDGEAARAGMDPDAYAAQTAKRWSDGLAAWGQDGARIARFREATEVAIYTPGSAAGRPITVLRTFNQPPAQVMNDPDALRERVAATVSGLLALLGIDTDPVQSREHILLSTLVQQAWQGGSSLDLAALVGQVQNPPIARIGVMDVESFFPQKERLGLALRINSMLAAPGFAAWLEGEPLDIARLLWTPAGKPRIAILSIAHLSDPERMFFVTVLLNEMIGWMRQQPGTPSLRALFYMDEIFGYFPPSAVPPSKTPMLTLLKQARAFGLGIVLATQNPVDLDYKGLANTGTWFLGRLQTERDKLRVLEGLEGASAATGGSFDRGEADRLLSGLKSRQFLVNNVHDDQPFLMESRWSLSYLRGPLTRAQIQALGAGEGAQAPAPAPAPAPTPASSAGSWAGSAAAPAAHPAASPAAPSAGGAVPPLPAAAWAQPATPASPPTPEPAASGSLPPLPAEAGGRFAAVRRPSQGGRIVYQAALLGEADLHFVKSPAVDQWDTRTFLAPLGDDAGPRSWESAQTLAGRLDLTDRPEAGATFAALPPAAQNAATYRTLGKAFETYLYQSATMTLFACPAFRLSGKPGETEADLRVRAREHAREERDRDVTQLRQRYQAKVTTLQERLRRAEERVGREQSQVQGQQMQTAISIGATVLGALFGRKAASVGTVGRATTAARGAGRVVREQQDVERAKADVIRLRSELADLQSEVEREAARVTGGVDPETAVITQEVVRPRKADTAVRRVELVWMPVLVSPLGQVTPAWDA